MSVRGKSKPLLLVVVTFALLLLFSATALGQCSMCRSALAGSNNAFFIRNFNIGVLILLIPPVTIFCSIFVVLKRYRAADAGELEAIEAESAGDDEPWRHTS